MPSYLNVSQQGSIYNHICYMYVILICTLCFLLNMIIHLKCGVRLSNTYILDNF